MDDGRDDYRVEDYEDLASFCGWGKLPWVVSYDSDYHVSVADGSCARLVCSEVQRKETD